MLARKSSCTLIVSFCVFAATAFADVGASTKTGAAPVYRSRSGGSGMVDPVRKSESRSSEQVKAAQESGISESDRAMISKQALESAALTNNESKPNKRKVPLSRSGGSASATYASVSR